MTTDLQLNPSQEQVIDAVLDHKYGMIHWLGAARAGKTRGATLAFLLHIEDTYTDGAVYMMAARVSRNAFSVMGEYLKQHCEYLDWDYEMRRGQHPEFTVHLPGGDSAKIMVFSGKDESSQDMIQGYTFRGALLDELGTMPESFFEMLMTRMSESQSLLIAMQNPTGLRHWTKKLWDNLSTHDRVLQVHTQLEENLHNLGEHYLTDNMTILNQHMQARMLKGEWADADGLVYRQVTKTEVQPIQFNEPVTIGVDYGGAGVTTAVYMVRRPVNPLNPQGASRVEIVKEYYHQDNPDAHRDYQTHAQQIVEKVSPGHIHALVIDHNATDMFYWFRNRSYSGVRLAHKSMGETLMNAQNMLSSGSAVIDTSCNNLLDEISGYMYNPVTDKPVKGNDHCVDAMRYALWEARDGNSMNITNDPMSLLGNQYRQSNVGWFL